MSADDTPGPDNPKPDQPGQPAGSTTPAKANPGWLQLAWKEQRGKVLAALSVPALALLTFLGNLVVDWVKDEVDPTEATVSGIVIRQDSPLRGVAVVLTKSERPAYSSVTDDAGQFIFVEVNDGLYNLQVRQDDTAPPLYSRHVHVIDDAPAVPVPTIVIDAVPQIQTPAPSPTPTVAPEPTVAAEPTEEVELAGTPDASEPTPIATATPPPEDDGPGLSASPLASPVAGATPETGIEETPAPTPEVTPDTDDPRDSIWDAAGDRFAIVDEDTMVPFFPRGAPTLAPAEESALPPVSTPVAGDDAPSPAGDAVAITYSQDQAPVSEGEATLWTVTIGLTDESGVASVTYYLNPAFQPSVVTHYAADGLELQLDSWASFEIGALVTYEDGSTVYLTAPITLIDA